MNEPADEVLAPFSPAPPQSRGARKWDPKLHGIGAQILGDIGVGRMRILARPKRIPSMAGFGLEVVEYLSPDEPSLVKAV